MATYSAGAAEVQIIPTLQGFGASVTSQLNTALSGVGAQAGQKAGGDLGQGLNAGVGPQLSRLTASLSALGQSASSAILRAMPALGQFADGFNGVATAATGLSGRMNALGGQARAALQPAITSVQSFAAGFQDSSAAASAFTGRLGTLGGLARTALQPAITGVQNFVSGLRDSDAAASAFTGRLGTVGGALRTVATVGGSTISGLSSDFASFSANAANQVQTQLSSAFLRVRDVGLTALSAIGVGSLAGLVASGIQRISDIEQTTKALDVLTGSAATAKQEMDDLLTFAKTTPFAFPDIAQIGKNLIAFGVDVNTVVPALKALGDAASASGRGAAGLGELGDILGVIAARGKISGDEIMRFAQAGVPALQILANTAGVTAAQMQADISNGAVDSQFAIHALITGIEDGTTGLAGQTAKFGGIMVQQKDTLVGALDSMHAAVTSSMATLLQPLEPAIRSAMGGIADAFKALPQIVSDTKAAMDQIGLTAAVMSIVDGIGGLVSAALPLLAQFAAGFASVFGPGIVMLLRGVGDALGWVGDHLKEWQPYITPLVTALGALWGIQATLQVATMAWGAAMLVGRGILAGLSVVTTAWSVAMTVLRGVIMGVQAAQWLLNTAWAVSPIGVIILGIAALTAAFVYLWTHSQGFRDFWISLWGDIEAIAVSVYRGALLPTWDGILAALGALGTAAGAVGGFFVSAWSGVVAAFQAIGAAASWLWSTVLSPVFAAIGLGARILAAVIITILLTPAVIAFNALAAVAQWLWSTVLAPVFAAIGAAAQWLWTNAIQPLINYVVLGFQTWAAIAMWLYANAIVPALNGIGAALSFVYSNVILPVVNFVVGGFQAVGNWATWLWLNAVVPAFNGLGAIIEWIYVNVILAAVNGVVGTFQLLGAVATWLWLNAVVPAWNGLGALIQWVYANMILPVINFAVGGFQLLGSWATWLWLNAVVPAFNGLGAIIGWVWDNGIRPVFDALQAALGAVGTGFQSTVDWIGQVWDRLRVVAAMPVNFVIDWVFNKGIREVWNAVAGFLGLALLPPAPLIQFVEGGVVPGYEPGRDRHLIAVSGGEGVLVPEAVQALGPAFIGWANAYFSGGRSAGGQGTPQQGGYATGGVVPGYADGGIVNSVLGFVGGLAQDAIDLFRSPVDWIKGHIGFPDSGWINELAQMPAAIISHTVDMIWSKITSLGGGGGGAASGDLLGWIRAAILFAGVPADWAGPLQTLIMRESGGNPRAINLTDINAQRGDPSRGLMQTIGATFNAFRDPRLSPDIYDPVSNIVAGIRYILATYGSIFNVQQANPNLPPKGYDTGGWLPPGLSTVYNGTGRNEAVLPRDDYDALINRVRGGDGASTINVYARTDADPESIAHTVDRHLALGMRL